MNSRQRAQLRGMANSLNPLFQVGKGGLNAQFVKQADDALEKRELIKLGVLETAPDSPREVAEAVAGAVGAEVVQVIGRKFVLYRESKEHKTIQLVK